MFNMPNENQLEMLKKKYPEGTRVALVHMEDPFTKIPAGTEGTVKSVDSLGTIHVSWDNGSSLGVVYNEDIVRKL